MRLCRRAATFCVFARNTKRLKVMLAVLCIVADMTVYKLDVPRNKPMLPQPADFPFLQGKGGHVPHWQLSRSFCRC